MSEHIHLLNGRNAVLTPKQKEKIANQNATLGEVEALAVKIAEHYHAQVPGLVEQVVCAVVPVIVAEILKQHGIELKAPDEPQV